MGYTFVADEWENYSQQWVLLYWKDYLHRGLSIKNCFDDCLEAFNAIYPSGKSRNND